jgi:plasmid stability protein
MTSYIIRNIPIALWAEVKARAASEGRSIRWLILRFLEAYAEKGSADLGG